MRRTTTALRPVLPVVVATALALTLGSCSGDDEPSSPASTSPSDASSTAETLRLDKANAALETRVVEIGGGVKKKQRSDISRQIAKPIQNWMDAAYLAGEFPRGDYGKKDLPGWTDQAASLALKDENVTTNAAVSKDVVRVVANQRTARLFVFAFRGNAGGATAKVLLTMTAEKESGTRMRYAVGGDVYLTRNGNKWRIFGYDLHRTVMH